MIDYIVETFSGASPLTVGLMCGGFLLSIAAWAEKEANDEIKKLLVQRIERFVAKSSILDIREIVTSGFDAIFGKRPLALRFIVSSTLYTTAWLVLISIFVASYWHKTDNVSESETLLYIIRDILSFNADAQYWVLVPILVVNYIGDFLSIIVTRSLVNRVQGLISLLGLLVVDVATSLLIYLVSFNSIMTAFGARTVWGIEEILGIILLTDADAGPELLLSTFSTTFWFIFVALGLLVLQIAKRFYKFQNYKKRPFFFVGYLSTIPAFVFGALVAMVL